jgi:LPS sulfotransferase NodH
MKKLSRIVLRLRSLSGKSHYRRFVIVCTSRTGSNWLVDLLNSHSKVLAFGELFRSKNAIGWDIPRFQNYQNTRLIHLYRSDPIAFLDKQVFKKWPANYSAIGFKLFYFQASESPYYMVWEYLRRNQDIAILHIKRRNLLEQYVSLTLARETGLWVKTGSSDQEPVPVQLKIESCQQHFIRVRNLELECARFFNDHHVLDIHYEDLVRDLGPYCDYSAGRQANFGFEMQRVQNFLGLLPEQVSSAMRRQKNAPLSQMISNYDELRQAFADTGWSEFFDEETSSQQRTHLVKRGMATRVCR